MTPDELYNRAVKKMNQCYTTGISCIDDAKDIQSVKFFRAYTQGEIGGINDMCIEMYLSFIYNVDNEDEESESRNYKNFCKKIHERSKALSDKIMDYASKIIAENTVD